MATEQVCTHCETSNAAERAKCRRCRRVLNPQSRGERSAAASIAANERWSRTKNRSLATAKARASGPASIDYWIKQVDPDNEMSPNDRVRAAENKRAAFYGRLGKTGRAAKRSAA